ncbi:YdcF family protein [Oleiagrimonas sp. C23AA]|uniref:YdcF family protein n=1 Tax=Oleiagrimonas sp. C23AA TaxID=2719047 RepID=UPI00142382E6|nr:YdcF family protein [Oleiagrimonas sp. C23AA]NII09725.1 YdcF family protein [Oleiagrimonas sp. C23AA]
MVLQWIFVLALLAAVLVGLRRRRTGLALGVVALLLVLLAGDGPLPRWLLSNLERGYATRVDHWGQRNAIILLGAGTVRGDSGPLEPGLFAHGRMLRAVMLYRDCKQTGAVCAIEVSGGDARGLGESEAQVYARQLLALGVPKADLLLEGRSMNTWQNAQFSAPLLAQFHADRLVLVSSATHLRRAQLYFGHFGIHATPIRGDYLTASPSWLPQAYNLTLTDVALHEYIGVARYHVYQAMGWNAASKHAGDP